MLVEVVCLIHPAGYITHSIRILGPWGFYFCHPRTCMQPTQLKIICWWRETCVAAMARVTTRNRVATNRYPKEKSSRRVSTEESNPASHSISAPPVQLTLSVVTYILVLVHRLLARPVGIQTEIRGCGSRVYLRCEPWRRLPWMNLPPKDLTKYSGPSTIIKRR